MVQIVKPSGCRCTDAFGERNVEECRPLLGALPLSLSAVAEHHREGDVGDGDAWGRPRVPLRGLLFVYLFIYRFMGGAVYVLMCICLMRVLVRLAYPRCVLRPIEAVPDAQRQRGHGQQDVVGADEHADAGAEPHLIPLTATTTTNPTYWYYY